MSTKDEFPQKLSKKLPDGWAESTQSADTPELKKIIVECEGNIYTIDKAKAMDEQLTAAKSLIKELGEPYREAKATQSAKIQFCLFLMENRGIDLDSSDDK